MEFKYHLQPSYIWVRPVGGKGLNAYLLEENGLEENAEFIPIRSEMKLIAEHFVRFLIGKVYANGLGRSFEWDSEKRLFIHKLDPFVKHRFSKIKEMFEPEFMEDVREGIYIEYYPFPYYNDLDWQIVHGYPLTKGEMKFLVENYILASWRERPQQGYGISSSKWFRTCRRNERLDMLIDALGMDIYREIEDHVIQLHEKEAEIEKSAYVEVEIPSDFYDTESEMPFPPEESTDS